ncbi:hypothetical protein Fmac_001719 [Flemingia macrophylla]|uniref:Uncharacterized protein n=1 Tax=Flemingia macrophylla TaxID=520843 RepID=A0ABD1NHX7_9FABA
MRHSTIYAISGRLSGHHHFLERYLRHFSHSFRASNPSLCCPNPYDRAIHSAYDLLRVIPTVDAFLLLSRSPWRPLRLFLIGCSSSFESLPDCGAWLVGLGWSWWSPTRWWISSATGTLTTLLTSAKTSDAPRPPSPIPDERHLLHVVLLHGLLPPSSMARQDPILTPLHVVTLLEIVPIFSLDGQCSR